MHVSHRAEVIAIQKCNGGVTDRQTDGRTRSDNNTLRPIGQVVKSRHNSKCHFETFINKMKISDTNWSKYQKIPNK